MPLASSDRRRLPSGPAGGGVPAAPDLPMNPATQVVRVAGAVDREIQDLAGRLEAYDALYALAALARGLSGIRGRKTILFFAEDREIPESSAHIYESTISAANRANVTIHTVDTRGTTPRRPGDRGAVGGVIAGMSASAPNGAPSQGVEGAGGPMMDREARPFNPVQGSFLEHAASDTGGLAIVQTNDIGAGLARVVEEVGQYYEVVYEPPRTEADGRFRRITARTTRKGVQSASRTRTPSPRSRP